MSVLEKVFVGQFEVFFVLILLASYFSLGREAHK